MTLQTGAPLTGEDVKLLEKGDWLLHERGIIGKMHDVSETHIRMSRDGVSFLTADRHQGFTFLGRPAPDGFMPAPGFNPAGALDVAYMVSDDYEDVRYGFADQLDWRSEPAAPKVPILRWRPASQPNAGESEPALVIPDETEGADIGREAIWKVVHEVWQLLDDAETDSAGITTPNQERWQAVSEAMDALEALVPDSEGPFWGGFPVNYLWPKGASK